MKKQFWILGLLATAMLIMLSPLTTAADIKVKYLLIPVGGESNCEIVGNASPADVLKGKTFSSKSAGIGAVGTLVCPPVYDDPMVGAWSGRMLYDRGYTGSNTCYDADVIVRVSQGPYEKFIDSITVRRDLGGGGLHVGSSAFDGITADGYVASSFYTFGMYTDYDLQFFGDRTAEGTWADDANWGGDCYGTWSFTKD